VKHNFWDSRQISEPQRQYFQRIRFLIANRSFYVLFREHVAAGWAGEPAVKPVAPPGRRC